uniref:Uncharacterized protein n=1 Tax=Arundo donax TaxID=35708 RepID=A0A0A9H0U2_ARUDO
MFFLVLTLLDQCQLAIWYYSFLTFFVFSTTLTYKGKSLFYSSQLFTLST